jgi:hypothetical protein
MGYMCWCLSYVPRVCYNMNYLTHHCENNQTLRYANRTLPS